MGSLAVKLTLSDGRNWYFFHKNGEEDQYWKKGIGNIDPDGFKVQGKYIPEILTLCSCGYRGRSNSARIIKSLQQR